MPANLPAPAAVHNRLNSAIGEAAPRPLDRAEAEGGEPQGREDQLDQPDDGDHGGLLHAVEGAEVAEAVAVEERGAEGGLQQIVRQRRPPHRRQRGGQD